MNEHIIIKNLNVRDYVIGKLLSIHPPYEMMNKFLDMELANYIGGFHDKFEWTPNSYNFKNATTEFLIISYNEIIRYWNKKADECDYYTHRDLIEYETTK